MKAPWLLFLVLVPCLATDRTITWQDVHLRDGEKVVVVRSGGDAVAGAVASATRDELHIRSHRKDVTVPAGAVTSIRIRRDTVRWRIIGTSVGVGIGIVGGALAAVHAGGLFDSGKTTGTVWVSVLAGCTAGGYTLGWLGDRRTETWTIRP